MQSDYIPDDASYYRFVNTQINQVYKEIWDAKDWVFVSKTVTMNCYPDKTSGRYNNATLTCALGGYKIVASVSVFGPEDWGQYVELEGVEYQITSYLSSTVVFVSDRLLCSTDVQTEWTVKHRDYYLPLDCVELLAITWRNIPLVSAANTWQGTVGIPKKIDDIANLDMQVTANRPDLYFPLPDPYVRTPEERYAPSATLNVTSSNRLAPGTYTFGYSYTLGDNHNNFDYPADPVYFPESALAPSTVSITVDDPTTGNVSFTVHQPLGPFDSAEVGNRAVGIKVYQILSNFDGSVEAVALLAKDRTGPLYAADATSTGTATVLIGNEQFTNIGRPIRSPNNGGRSKAIRFYPRVDSIDWSYDPALPAIVKCFFDARYIYRPEQLFSDGDVPEMPEEFHLLIADMVSARLALRHGKLAENQLLQRSIMERRKMLETRYGTYKDTQVVRGQSMQAGRHGFPWPYPGTVTWRGQS